MPMGAWGGDNAPGRSRANRPTMRNPHRSDPQMTGNCSERACVLGGCKALWNSVFHGAGPTTDMGRMEQLNYRGRNLEVTGHESVRDRRGGHGHGRSPNPAPSEEEGGRGQRDGETPPTAGEYLGDAVNNSPKPLPSRGQGASYSATLPLGCSNDSQGGAP
jgi:hypothetical protein